MFKLLVRVHFILSTVTCFALTAANGQTNTSRVKLLDTRQSEQQPAKKLGQQDENRPLRFKKLFSDQSEGVYLNIASRKLGGSNGGGGDDFIIDFVQVAGEKIYPWLKKYGNSLSPQISPDQFLSNVDPARMASAPHVYESCRFRVIQVSPGYQMLEALPENKSGKLDREVPACYNDTEDITYLNRALYPLGGRPTSAKIVLIAHEVFRRMGLETDQYEVSKQMNYRAVRFESALQIQLTYCTMRPGCALNQKEIFTQDDLDLLIYRTEKEALLKCKSAGAIGCMVTSSFGVGCNYRLPSRNTDPIVGCDAKAIIEGEVGF